jgi:AAA family ATP:ADP antiporter
MVASARLNPLERFLNVFTDVRQGEAAAALLLALNIFLILTAYYVLKPVREALILAGGGAEIKSYAAAGQAVLLLGAVPLYGWVASRVPRHLLINGVTLFFAACLLVFYGLAQLQVPLGVVFFLWVGIFNLMVPAQFWAFANDIYTPEAGKRLFVLVAFGASCGAVAGSYLDALLIGRVGVYELMLVAAGILAASLLLTNLVDRRERSKRAVQASAAIAGTEDEPLKKGNAFAMVLGNRYLLLIALLMLVLNWVNTTGEYILGRTVLSAAQEAVATGTAGALSEEEYIGGFYAEFFTVVNLAGLLLQLFVVSRVLKYLGVGVAVTILPLIALGGYLIAAFYPVLGIIRWAKTAENATDYSLQNTVRQVLFLPTTREQKYKAKQAIDTFFVRAGDVLSAVLVFAGTTWLALSTQGFALVNAGLVFAWLILAILIGRHYRRLTQARAPDVASRRDGVQLPSTDG